MRNVECIADVLVLIAGSERLLKLMQEKGIEKLIEEDKVKTRFIWVQDSSGVMRWRIELIEDTEVEMERISLKPPRRPSPEAEDGDIASGAHSSEMSLLHPRQI